jgi:hypothetical protein
LANTYVFFLFNMGWSWLVYECLLSLKKDGWVHQAYESNSTENIGFY